MTLESIFTLIGSILGASLASGGVVFKILEVRQSRFVAGLQAEHATQVTKLQEGTKSRGDDILDHQKLAEKVYELYEKTEAYAETMRKEQLAWARKDAEQQMRITHLEESKAALEIRVADCERRWLEHHCDKE